MHERFKPFNLAEAVDVSDTVTARNTVERMLTSLQTLNPQQRRKTIALLHLAGCGTADAFKDGKKSAVNTVIEWLKQLVGPYGTSQDSRPQSSFPIAELSEETRRILDHTTFSLDEMKTASELASKKLISGEA